MPLLILGNDHIYPAFRHHLTEEPKIVRSKEEDDLLDNNWADCPMAFDGEPEEQPERVKGKPGRKPKVQP